ncbi:MAG: hypothetical protein SPE11_13925, partial [Parabacteroides sp.]|nr:hypothetical protein [Parabacteroides sp.]
MTSQCLYLQVFSGLVDNDKLIKLYPLFHYEHAEIVAAFLDPIAAHILLLADNKYTPYSSIFQSFKVCLSLSKLMP